MRLSMKMNNKRGTVLILTYLVVTVLLILGIAFVSRSIVESRIAERQKKITQALAIAEGGLERTLYHLRRDFVLNLISPSWADGQIDDIVYGLPDTNNFYAFSLSSPTLESGSYSVELKNVVGASDEIWVRSTGTVDEISRVIQAYVKIEEINPWKNVIFAGVGASGAVINGNVDIRGSVLILGESLTPTDLAMDMSGSGFVGNNYKNIPNTLSLRIPPCPTTTFGGEIVESLEAKLRVRHGLVGLSGTATVGEVNIPADAYKETVDGVFVTDGYGGNKGADNVNSDNGTGTSYDLGSSVRFPSLSDAYVGDPTITYQQYLRNNAYVIQDLAKLNKIANITPQSQFNYGDVNGSITMDGNGNMTIQGIVYVDGGNMNMNKQGNDDTITYSGSGSILVTGNVGINVNLFTPASANSFPTNILGVMTPNSITFDAAQIDVMGIFYAEDSIISQKQTDVAGTFAANYFDMGQQVPSIFQVPDVVDSLPPGMIASQSVWVISVVAWQRL